VITTTQGIANVELIPGVTTSVNVSRDHQPDASQPRPLQAAVVAELENAIEQLRRVHRQLQATSNPDEDGDGQQDMFPSKRRTKR
jgi:hypothetical protein